MREWIKDLKEGQSAFENADDSKKLHQVVNGEILINKSKNGDKYKRQKWDLVAPCIHTRNDQLASQNTIHPSDDGVQTTIHKWSFALAIFGIVHIQKKMCWRFLQSQTQIRNLQEMSMINFLASL